MDAAIDTSAMRKLGFDEKETRIYLFLLQAGSVTASKIASETGIDRATSYRYLESLMGKGFVSYVVRNNVKYFQAAHPRKILENIKEKEAEYSKIMPLLISLIGTPRDETEVEVYKGIEGLKTVLKDVLRTKENHFVLGDEGHFQELLPSFFKQFVRDCKKDKIREKIICSKDVVKKIKKYEYSVSEIRTLPHKNILPTTTLIYGEKVVIFNWRKPCSAIVISNKDLSKSYLSYFEMLWKTAKK